MLAIPFGAPAGDASAEKLADAAFAQTYGRLALAHHGQVGLDKDASPPTMRTPLSPARAPATRPTWSTARSAPGSAQVLSVTVAKVEDGSVVWTQSYPIAGADPTKIAEEIDSKVPTSDDEDE